MLRILAQRGVVKTVHASPGLRPRSVVVGLSRFLSDRSSPGEPVAVPEPVGSSSISSLLSSDPIQTITTSSSTEKVKPAVAPIDFGTFTSSIQSDFVQNSEDASSPVPVIQRRLRFPDSATLSPSSTKHPAEGKRTRQKRQGKPRHSKAKRSPSRGASPAKQRISNRRRSRKGSEKNSRGARSGRANLGSILSPKLQLSCRTCSQPIVDNPRNIDLLCTNGGYHLIAKDWQMPKTYAYESLTSVDSDNNAKPPAKGKESSNTTSHQVEAWNRTAKITCPNCASYVGSQLSHETGFRRGVLFKGACLQWTNTSKGWVSSAVPVWRSDFHFLVDAMKKSKGTKESVHSAKFEKPNSNNNAFLEAIETEVVLQNTSGKSSRVGLGVLWQHRHQVQPIEAVESARARLYRQLDSQRNATALLRVYAKGRDTGALSMMNLAFTLNKFVHLASREVRAVTIRAKRLDAEVLLADVSQLLNVSMQNVSRRQRAFGDWEVAPREKPNPLSFLPLGVLVEFANNVERLHPDPSVRRLVLGFVADELRYAAKTLHVALLPEAQELLDRANSLLAEEAAESGKALAEGGGFVARIKALFNATADEGDSSQGAAVPKMQPNGVSSLTDEQVVAAVSMGCDNHLLPAFRELQGNETSDPSNFGFGVSRQVGQSFAVDGKKSTKPQPAQQAVTEVSGGSEKEKKLSKRRSRRSLKAASEEKHLQESLTSKQSELAYNSSIPANRVFMVDTKEKLELATARFNQLMKAAEEMHQNTGIRCDTLAVACDAEWKPVFRKGQSVRCAVFQVSTRTETYVFDVLQLKEKLAPLLGQLLTCDSVIKIGHSVREDLYVLAEATKLSATGVVVGGEETPRTMAGPCVDVTQLAARKHGRHHSIGLKRLIANVTGRQLKKSGVQMSNWELRPLASDQIKYAAMDASCLFQVYDWYRFELLCDAQKSEGEDGPVKQGAGLPFVETDYFLAYSFARDHARSRRSKGIPYHEIETQKPATEK